MKKLSNRAKYNIFIFVAIIFCLVGLVRACFGVITDACLYFSFASLLIICEVEPLYDELQKDNKNSAEETEVKEHEENN